MDFYLCPFMNASIWNLCRSILYTWITFLNAPVFVKWNYHHDQCHLCFNLWLLASQQRNCTAAAYKKAKQLKSNVWRRGVCENKRNLHTPEEKIREMATYVTNVIKAIRRNSCRLVICWHISLLLIFPATNWEKTNSRHEEIVWNE